MAKISPNTTTNLCDPSPNDVTFQTIMTRYVITETTYCDWYEKYKLSVNISASTDDFNEYLWGSIRAWEKVKPDFDKITAAIIFILNGSLIATFLLRKSVRSKIPNQFIFNQALADWSASLMIFCRTILYEQMSKEGAEKMLYNLYFILNPLNIFLSLFICVGISVNLYLVIHKPLQHRIWMTKYYQFL